MLLNKLNSLKALVLLSLLGHLALAALVLQQQFAYQPPTIQPAPLQVFAVTRLPQRSPPTAPVIQPVAEPAIKPPAPTPVPVPQKQPEPMRTPTRAVTAAAANPAKISPAKISPAPAPSSAAPTERPVDLSAVFSSVQQQAARRELSAAELAALSAPKTETGPRTVTTAPSGAVRRPAVKPGSGPAGDVLETLADGKQLVRVGKQCVLASPGADLRKDIHSMKLVACGAGGNSEQDKIDAHFEQVMSKIGQHR